MRLRPLPLPPAWPLACLLTVLGLVAGAAAQTPLHASLGWRWGGVNFTPGGYADFTLDYRSARMGLGLGTPFAALPYSDTAAALTPQWRMGVERSRLSLEAAGTRADMALAADAEMDFSGTPLGAARLRLVYLDLRHGGWEVMAGRDWSLLTPNRSGVSPRPADVELGALADSAHQAGLISGRRGQVRAIWHARPRWALALSAEISNPYIGGSSGALPVTLPGGSTGPFAAQVNRGSSTTVSGDLPDLIAKAAYDSGEAGTLHLEAATLLSPMRIADPVTGRGARAWGGGLMLAGEGRLAPAWGWMGDVFLGSGAGWLLDGIAPNLTVSPNGVPHPLHADGGWAALTWQPRRRDRLYAAYGGVLLQPSFTLAPTSAGYGYPGSPHGMNRSVQELSLTLNHTLWRSPRAGLLLLRLQAAYAWRDPFAGALSGPSNAQARLGFLDLRYSLP